MKFTIYISIIYIYVYIYEFGIYKIKNIQASLQSISKITNVLKIDMMILLQVKMMMMNKP